MKAGAWFALLLLMPNAASAYTVKLGAAAVGDQASQFNPVEFPQSTFVERPEQTNAAMGSSASAFDLKAMDSQTELKTRNALTELGARQVGRNIIVDLPSDILFDFDRSSIRADARPTLERLSGVLLVMPDTSVRIIGHTDSKGSNPYNQHLSEQRAASVEAWLADSGVASSMSTEGKGETMPVAENQNKDGSDNPSGRQRNRRVQIIIGGK